jgi:hypothetical protein
LGLLLALLALLLTATATPAQAMPTRATDVTTASAGNCLLAIDGSPIRCAADVKKALAQTKGSANLTVQRKNEKLQIRVSPTITADGPKLGIYLKEGVTGIGNNVSFRYEEMDFEGCSEAVLVIDGATPLAENPITLRMQTSDGGERTEMVAFRGGKGRCEQRFAVSVPGGVCSLTFVFLPGSCFDFYSFRFERR